MRLPSDDSVELLLTRGPVPLRCVGGPDSLLVVASDGAAEWPMEVLRRGTVQVRTSGGRKTLGARLVAGAGAREEVLERFRQRYGPDAVAQWFPHPGRMLRLIDGLAAPTDPYRSWLAQEFDAAADGYIPHVLANPIEGQARRRSADLLLRVLRDRSRLLELGSGPGLETLPLLEAGHHVTAVDISSAMLRLLEGRAAAAGVGDRLTTVTSDLSDLAAVGPGPFDGAYSTFGAMNCVPDLTHVRASLADRLRPGAPLVAGVYNRVSLSEIGWYSLGGQPSRALARLSAPVPVGRSRFSVDWFPRTAEEVVGAFAPDFRWDLTEAIGLVAPPPELFARFEARPALLESLLRADTVLDRTVLGRLFGDQLLVHLHRRGPGA